MTQSAVQDLLVFFRSNDFGKFPTSAKTFLKTPIVTETRRVPPGEYWHRGLKEDIIAFVKKYKCTKVIVEFNSDGLPIAKSSGGTFYPISCSFNGYANVALAGLYYGPSKPNNFNDLLSDFVHELRQYEDFGLVVDVIQITIEVGRCVCDTPARADVLNTKHCSGYGAFQARFAGRSGDPLRFSF